jgi:hypothetical protein
MTLVASSTFPSGQGQVSAFSAGLVFRARLGQAAPPPSSSGVSAMRWSAFSLCGILGLLAAIPTAQADQDYGVLIISRERLEVAISCEIGVYIQDQLAGRVFQEQSVSFNLPAGDVSIRLRTLPGAVFGCDPGMEAQSSTRISIKAGDILKYRIASSLNGLYLKRADLNYQ